MNADARMTRQIAEIERWNRFAALVVADTLKSISPIGCRYQGQLMAPLRMMDDHIVNSFMAAATKANNQHCDEHEKLKCDDSQDWG